MLNRPLWVFDFKGGPKSLSRMCIDWALANGFAKRLRIWSFSDPDHLPVFNTVDGTMPPANKTASIQEAFLSGMSSLDYSAMPVLWRMSWMVLYCVVERELDFTDAWDILQPNSALRLKLLEGDTKIQDPFMWKVLKGYDLLPERRQEELSSSCKTRLANFFAFPEIRHCMTAKGGPTMEETILAGTINVVELGFNKPLPEFPCKMLSRFIMNDLIATVEHLDGEGRLKSPVHCLIDEFQ